MKLQVGHRGCWWRIFQRIKLVDEDALAKIEELSALAPLHNPGVLRYSCLCDSP